MLAKRIIPCLDVADGRVVKGVQFLGLRDAGDPVEIAKRYDEEGADEIVFLDIHASTDNRETMRDLVRKTAEQVFMPLCVGGGIRTLDDISGMLNEQLDHVYIPVFCGNMKRSIAVFIRRIDIDYGLLQ